MGASAVRYVDMFAKFMTSYRNLVLWIYLLQICCMINVVTSLRDVVMTLPEAVPSGEAVTLRCHYDLQGDPLYTVKWYRGRSEFFRYLPKELPHTRTFPGAGLNVDETKSGPNQVVLRSLLPNMSGRYKCEVSADAPSFDTAMVGGYLTVVDLPEGPPIIYAEKQRYVAGDVLKAKCTAPPTSPAANLTWFINDKKINKILYPNHRPFTGSNHNGTSGGDHMTNLYVHQFSDVPDHMNAINVLHGAVNSKNSVPDVTDLDPGHTHFQQFQTVHNRKRRLATPLPSSSATQSTVVNTRSSNMPEKRSTTVYLEIPLESKLFEDGKLKLRCIGELYQLYRAHAEIILDEGPRLAPILATRESGADGVSINSVLLVITATALIARAVR